MFIDLIDSLRCVTPHAETWLVAAVARMEGRHVIEGTLGCPTCQREYPIRDGVGWFTAETYPPDPTDRKPAVGPAVDSERLIRAAAMLGLADGGGLVVLGGDWADCAPGLTAIASGHYVVLNARHALPMMESVSLLRVDVALPLAPGSVRALALDARTASSLLQGAPAVLRSGGRLVAPAAANVPNDIGLLARDAEHWVGERAAAASKPVALRSVRRPEGS